MKYTSVGRSGLKVSRLCLGAWNFGTRTDEQEAFRIMDAALDAGINFFDTANHYPDFEICGRSEEIIGRWFAQGGGRRERVVLATKVYQPMMDPADGPNNEGGLSKYKIRRHLEGSLERLQTDHIDLYQMHHVDRDVGWDEIWEAFGILTYQGKIGYVGSSNFPGWCLAMAQAAARERHGMGLISEQHRYNLLCRLPELEVLPAAQTLGIGVLAYSPLASGALKGEGSPAPEGSGAAKESDQADPHREQFAAYDELCRDLGESGASVATAWILANPALTAAIVGPRTRQQVAASLRAVELDLDQETMSRLDSIFPGPGGPAPEAYAW
jgi:aryl-alcohol dehydrogenase-like predicted oxidoreductase